MGRLLNWIMNTELVIVDERREGMHGTGIFLQTRNKTKGKDVMVRE